MRIKGINGKSGRQELEDIGIYANNLMFLVADMLETAMIDSMDANRRAGYTLRYSDKHYLQSALYNLKRFRSSTVTCGEHSQALLGKDSDSWIQFIWMAVDRLADKPEELYELYKKMKSYPSAYHLDFDEDAEEPFLRDV